MVVSGSADSNMRPIMKIASYLESNQGAVETEGLEHMEWPAVSQDLNHMENMWI